MLIGTSVAIGTLLILIGMIKKLMFLDSRKRSNKEHLQHLRGREFLQIIKSKFSSVNSVFFCVSLCTKLVVNLLKNKVAATRIGMSMPIGTDCADRHKLQATISESSRNYSRFSGNSNSNVGTQHKGAAHEGQCRLAHSGADRHPLHSTRKVVAILCALRGEKED